MSRAPSQPSKLPEATMLEFATSIGLRPQVGADQAVLRQMMGEARVGYHRLCQDRACLLPYLQRDASIRPPYAATQISEAALRREVERVHAAAVDETRAFYDRGMVAGDAGAGSWVVRWLLWYMLLHGDERDAYAVGAQSLSHHRRDEPSPAVRSGNCHVVDAPAQLVDRNGERKTERGCGQYWDPARSS